MTHKSITQNRELSWLSFNERVLNEARDASVPLLERLKFLSIFSSNLDEFFMIRVGTLFDMKHMGLDHLDSKTGMTPSEQINCILKRVIPLYKKKDKIYKTVSEILSSEGICDLEYDDLTKEEKRKVIIYFNEYIVPILSPQIVDSHHPFPHLHSNALHYIAHLNSGKLQVYGIIPIPQSVKAIFHLGAARFIRVENIIMALANNVFQNYKILHSSIIRTTRNEDINFDDYAIEMEEFSSVDFENDKDFRKKMKGLLQRRKRLASVRLEVSKKTDSCIIEYLCKNLNLSLEQVFKTSAPLDLSYAFGLEELIPKHKYEVFIYPTFKPSNCSDIDLTEPITSQIKKQDLLLSYPFESMKPFLRLLKESASDPNVVSIKITIYRLASQPRLVEYLCSAAENGKDVTVLIELRARFDEKNNIAWSERLEEAGCNILYGFENLKVHSKICLITRKEKGSFTYITQIGTGNYNESTSKVYTDVSLITANKDIGLDATEFFKNMGIGNLNGVYQHLLVAPSSLKSGILELIDEQITLGEDGFIFIKINSLADNDIIKKLHLASMAGVKVKLIIRGICCIVPGVAGETEHIEVTNIIGRFLEHSRIYVFGKGDASKIYLSSADFMKRNTQRRIEVACPLYDPLVRNKIMDIMNICDLDNVKACILQANGKYVRKKTDGIEINSQDYLLKRASSSMPNYRKSIWKGFTIRVIRAWGAFWE